MTRLSITPLKELHSCEVSEKSWTNYLVAAKALEVVQLISKNTGKTYQVVILADSSGVRLVRNCTDNMMEKNQNYQVVIRTLKKSPYVMSCFVDTYKVSPHPSPVLPIVDPELEWVNEHSIYLTLVVKTVSKLNCKYPSISPLPDEDLDELENGPTLIQLEDEENRKYYYRIWPNDPTSLKDQFLQGSTWAFENVSLNKLKG